MRQYKHCMNIHPRIAQYLSSTGTQFRLWRHADLSRDISSPVEFSEFSGIPIERITKTVLFRERSGPKRLVLANAPILDRLDLKALAREVDFGPVELAPVSVLTESLDYPPTGVSPFGIALEIPIIVDLTVLAHSSVTVGGGATGIEIELSPQDLLRIEGARAAPIIRVSV